MREPFAFEGWSFDPDTGELERDGVHTRLQDLPRQLLSVLLERAGTLVTREELIRLLWPAGTVLDFDTSLNSAVRKLRTALGEDADHPRYIETMPKRGYRFIARLTPSNGPKPPERSVEAPSAAGRRPWNLIGLVAALIVLLVAVVAMQRWLASPAEPSSQPTVLRLAVLPFENLSPDPANAFFADGMHEEMLTALANRATNLQVISRTTMLTYAKRRMAIPEIARELHATHVLEGSVRRDGTQLRINLQLIDARTDAHVWSQAYDRPMQSVIALQTQMADEVSRQLAVRLTAPRTQQLAKVDPEAYDLYLKAKLFAGSLNAMSPEWQYHAHEGAMTRAIALNPDFADAYIVRAEVRLRKFTGSHDLSEANLFAVREDIETARRIAGNTQQLLAIESQLAIFLEDDGDKAAEFMRLAESVGPLDSAQLVQKAVALGNIGRWEEMQAVFAHARRLDQANRAATGLAMVYHWADRRPVEALRLAREFDTRYPGQLAGYGNLIRAFTGRLERTRLEAEAYRGIAAPHVSLSVDFTALRYEGRFDELARLLATTPVTHVREAFVGGLLIAGIGFFPVAEQRAWSKLLVDRNASTREEGRVLLEYVRGQPRTRWNDWFLTAMEGEAELFMGNEARAIAAARTVIAKVQSSGPLIARAGKAHAVRILAWAGAHDEAVTLLEGLTTERAAIGPAEVVRDPLFFKPLQGNPRYEALAVRLEREIEENLKAMAPLMEGGSVPQPGRN